MANENISALLPRWVRTHETSSAFEQTMKAASELTVAKLKQLDDVDRPEDIPPKISVIIPTLNEEFHLLQALGSWGQGNNADQ